MAKKKIVNKVAFGNMGKTVTYEDGSSRTFLNPHGKGKKFACELHENCHVTNDMSVIKSEGLTKTERSYRAGYLDAQKDSAAIYKKKHGGA